MLLFLPSSTPDGGIDLPIFSSFWSPLTTRRKTGTSTALLERRPPHPYGLQYYVQQWLKPSQEYVASLSLGKFHHLQWLSINTIPQFLLRNFSHPYKPLEEVGRNEKHKKSTEKGKYRGDKVLNVVDLASDEPRLIESPVSRWFGQVDMYKDVYEAIKSRSDVEDDLSKLECRTAQVLRKVKKAQENNESAIWLQRAEKNTLRKFLFIMKYRGPGFHEKYFADNARDYNSEDKHLLMAYMAEKGITKPGEVWLHNLRTILDIDMDVEGKWMIRLPKLMFPPDSQMFIFHVGSSYMAFCAPSEAKDEFILTDNCFNNFEGPNNETFCAKTGEYIGNTYLCYHEFGPVSPQLIIVLRSLALPQALEDEDAKVRRARSRMLNAAMIQFSNPEHATSILLDLPVEKATNSYSRVVNGRLKLESGRSIRPITYVVSISLRSSQMIQYEWPQYKDVCYKLYIEERRSLEDMSQQMREMYNFHPSKRAYSAQFKRWGFPSKQHPAHQNADLVLRVKELWEANCSQKDMLKTLNNEGWELKKRELMRLRARNRWLLRIPNGMKQYGINTHELNKFRNELLGPAGVQTVAHTRDCEPGPAADSALLDGVLRKRKDRHNQRQTESTERLAAKKRHRRTREYGGLPADPPGPPRFPSETTLEECKSILFLNVLQYREIRNQFDSICREEGVMKKTLAGADKWRYIKDRLIQENEQMRHIFWTSQTNLASKQLALDVIATDVTKCMRGISRSMTIVEAKNTLGLNPKQSRVVRKPFYAALQNDRFTSRSETGPEHWQELKSLWLERTPIIKDRLAAGNTDPQHQEKQKAIETLFRDVTKRLRDDQERGKISEKATTTNPIPPKPSTEAELIAVAAAANKAFTAAQQPFQSAYQFTCALSDLEIGSSLSLKLAGNSDESITVPVAAYGRPHAESQVQWVT